MTTARTTQEPLFLNVREVAAAIQVCPRTVVRLVESGTLPQPRKFGRASRWPARQIAELAEGTS